MPGRLPGIQLFHDRFAFSQCLLRVASVTEYEIRVGIRESKMNEKRLSAAAGLSAALAVILQDALL